MRKVIAVLGLVLLLIGASATTTVLPSFDTTKWGMTGLAPGAYNSDRTVDSGGVATITLASNSQATTHTWGTMDYGVDATKYRGGHLAVSGLLSTGAATSGQFWMRVDADNGKILQFDNMANRALEGDNAWTPFEIVLDVPTNARQIVLGLLLQGTGSASARDVRFGPVPDDTPSTNTWNQP